MAAAPAHQRAGPPGRPQLLASAAPETEAAAPVAPRQPALPGFRLGTTLYRRSYDLTDAVDGFAERVLGVQGLGLRRGQERLVNWIGDRRFWDRGHPLVGPSHLAVLRERLRPGDLILTRKEGYFSNIAMPGHWKHALIYVGTPAERRAWFSTPGVAAWVAGSGVGESCFDALLRRCHGPVYEESCGQDDAAGAAVLSSDGRGVGFDALEACAQVDSLAVLRPRMDRLALAQALDTAFGFVGFPYDFLFDFSCDQSFICSEVIYKAYHRGPMRGGLALRTRNIAGRDSMPTNDLAQLYSERRATVDQDLELVVYFEGDEHLGEAFEASEPRFAESWARSAWEESLAALRSRLLPGQSAAS
jgi:hypothetical protein